MARTVQEIKAEIGNAYISQIEVQQKYSITPQAATQGFDANFSKASVESLFFYAIAYAVHIFERTMDVFKAEIQQSVELSFVANEAWWHNILDNFQRGYDLIFNEKTFKYEYSAIDNAAKIIKRRAVRQKADVDGVYKVFLYVASQGSSGIMPITENDLLLIDAYANKQKPAGVLVKVVSGGGDELDIALTVNFNPLLLKQNGELVSSNEKPVDTAAASYVSTLNDTAFGGRFNVTRFIDMIQMATGVVDVKITALSINGIPKSELWGTYESTNGWFNISSLNVTYQPQIEI